MEADPPEAQPKKTWMAVAVEGARPSAKAKTVPFPRSGEAQAPKAEPKGKAAPVPGSKGSADDASGDSRGSDEKLRRERKSRWDPEEPTNEAGQVQRPGRRVEMTFIPHLVGRRQRTR